MIMILIIIIIIIIASCFDHVALIYFDQKVPVVSDWLNSLLNLLQIISYFSGIAAFSSSRKPIADKQPNSPSEDKKRN